MEGGKMYVIKMRYLLTIMLLFSLSAFAEEKSCEQLLKEGATKEQIVQQGCCSHHQGVCSCSGGRAVCCDGQFSPTCGCHGDDIKEFTKQNESEQLKS
jgi:hypothetical protein